MLSDIRGPGQPHLSFALGAYSFVPPVKALLAATEGVEFRFPEFSNINRAFAPMVRDGAYDISEMAITTFLLARAYDKPFVPLPVVTAARFQQFALICRADGPVRGPGDLVRRRVGVRSYSQTTAAWLRGILQEEYEVSAQDIRWMTQEASHLAEYTDPDGVERLSAGGDLLSLLRQGALDAVIVGNDYVPEPAFRPVFGDVDASVSTFWSRHGFVPVNHLIVARSDVVQTHPDIMRSIISAFAAVSYRLDTAGHECAVTGRGALQPSFNLMQRYMGLHLSDRDIWGELPDDIG